MKEIVIHFFDSNMFSLFPAHLFPYSKSKNASDAISWNIKYAFDSRKWIIYAHQPAKHFTISNIYLTAFTESLYSHIYMYL